MVNIIVIIIAQASEQFTVLYIFRLFVFKINETFYVCIRDREASTPQCA